MEKDRPERQLRFAQGGEGKGPFFTESRSLEEVRSKRLRQVYDIWHAKRPRPDTLPLAETFDILDYRAGMGWINLLAVQYDPLDFMFRVHCVSGVSYIGKDLTGQSVDAYPEPQYRGYVRAVYEATVERRAPQIVIEDMFLTDRRVMRWEGMTLPLQDESGKVSLLIVAFEILS